MKYLFPIVLTITCCAIYTYLCLLGMGLVGTVAFGVLFAGTCILAFCIVDAPLYNEQEQPVETAEAFLARMQRTYKRSTRITDSTIRVGGKII